MAIFKEDDFLDVDLIDIFISRFTNSASSLKSLIEGLKTPSYPENLNEMFRIFHNLKATSSFLESPDVLEIAKLAESVVSLLQNSTPPFEDRIMSWLFELSEQFEIWANDFEENGENLTPLKNILRKDLTVTTATREKPENILKKLKILYVTYKQHQMDVFFQTDLKDLTQNVFFAKSAQEAVAIYKKEKPDIIFTDLILPKINGFKLIQTIKKSKVNIPIIILTALNNIEYEKKAKLMGVTTYLNKSISKEDFLIELHRIVNTYFTDKKIKIINSDVLDVVEKLPPLPDSVFEIQKICNDEDSSINDLIKAVKKDPIIAANILKTAKSPLFGFKNVSTIDKSVTLFGKNAVQAFAFGTIAHNKFVIDLSPYTMSQLQFSQVSQKRVKVMIKWYAKVAFHRLITLATSSLIGNLGQIIIANEVKKLKKEEDFRHLIERKGRKFAELEMFNVTTEEVTADILNYWELPHILSDSIRYSYNLDFAYPEVKDYAIANRVIFEMVEARGNVRYDVPYDIEKILNANDIPLKPLKKALISLS